MHQEQPECTIWASVLTIKVLLLKKERKKKGSSIIFGALHMKRSLKPLDLGASLEPAHPVLQTVVQLQCSKLWKSERALSKPHLLDESHKTSFVLKTLLNIHSSWRAFCSCCTLKCSCLFRAKKGSTGNALTPPS